MKLKSATPPPSPPASDATATNVNTGERHSRRAP